MVDIEKIEEYKVLKARASALLTMKDELQEQIKELTDKLDCIQSDLDVTCSKIEHPERHQPTDDCKHDFKGTGSIVGGFGEIVRCVKCGKLAYSD